MVIIRSQNILVWDVIRNLDMFNHGQNFGSICLMPGSDYVL